MNAKKKLSAGSWAALVAALLTVVSFVLYMVNISSAGYYKDAAVGLVPVFGFSAVAALLIAAYAALVSAKGVASKLVDVVVGLLQIAAPALLALTLINLISGRVEGLAYIYFSNADVIKEVQTAENLSSATMAIASMAGFGVSMVAAMVAAFFNIRKDDVK